MTSDLSKASSCLPSSSSWLSSLSRDRGGSSSSALSTEEACKLLLVRVANSQEATTTASASRDEVAQAMVSSFRTNTKTNIRTSTTSTLRTSPINSRCKLRRCHCLRVRLST